MAEIKTLLDEYGIIHEANKILPGNNLKLKFLESLAELEDNIAHRTGSFPKTRLYKVSGIKQKIYRADIDSSGYFLLYLSIASSISSFINSQYFPRRQIGLKSSSAMLKSVKF